MSASKPLDYESPHKKSAKKFILKEYIQLTAGPANFSDRVLQALSMQCLNPLSKEMHLMMDEVKAMLQYLFQTTNPLTLVNQTSGSGGNESILTNLLDSGDKLVIAVGGTWGEKVQDMAQRYAIDVLAIRKPPGEIFTLEELEDAVKSHQANLLFVTHGESSGGTLQQLEGIGPMCHKYDCLLAVDAVASMGVDPLYTDRWQLDAVCTASQKAIGSPPGLCLLTFSPRAEKRIKAKKTKSPYYFDMTRQGLYFDCFVDDHSRQYHYTFSSNLLAALREALAQVCEEGLSEVWERHKRNSEYLWKKMGDIGLECFVEKVQNRFHGITCIKIPSGIDQLELLKFVKDKYDIEIAYGHGPTLNKAMRIGLLGQNSRPEVVDYLVQALKDGMEQLIKRGTN